MWSECTGQHGNNLVLGGFNDYYSNLAGKLLKKLHKPPSKFTLNTVFQHYKGIIQSDSYILAIVSENTIFTILKITNVSKSAVSDKLSGRFLKDGAEILAQPITDLCNPSTTQEKLNPISKKHSLAEASNFRPISLLPLISKVIDKVIHDQTSTFFDSRNLLYSINLVFAKLIPLTAVCPF